LAVDVVLPDGSGGRFGSEAPAAAGYDLRGYIVGSEGTLGIVTAACVRLTPLPPAVRTMLLDFADVEDCAQTVSAIIARGVVPAGDGNLHPLFSFDRSVPGTLERVLAASDELVRLCVDAGGSLSGEHGIGLEKRDFMPLVFTAEDLDAQACLRSAFDPDGRMN